MIIKEYCLCERKFTTHEPYKYCDKYVDCDYKGQLYGNLGVVDFYFGDFILGFDMMKNLFTIKTRKGIDLLFQSDLKEFDNLSIQEIKEKVNFIITYL